MQHPPLPELSASLVSRLLFSWLTPLITLGAQRPLELSDLFDIAPQDNPVTLERKLKREWKRRRNTTDSYWALGRSVWAIVQTDYLFVCACSLGASLCEVALPVVLSWLIIFLSDKEAEWWEGVIYVALALCVLVAHMLLQTRWLFGSVRVGMNVMSMLQAIVYRKSLRLQRVPKGKATNLMNVDPITVGDGFWFAHWIVAQPPQLILSIYLLYQWLGLSSLMLVVILVVICPFIYFMSRGQERATEDMMKLRDERIKKLTEVIQGVSIVKMFCWEHKVMQQIGDVRAKEVWQLKKYLYILACVMFLVLSLSTLMSVSTFSVYVLMGNVLKASQIFPALTIFSSLTWVTLRLPDLISNWIQAKASLERLNEFLRLEEIHGVVDEDDHLADGSIRIVNGQYEWQRCDGSDDAKEDDRHNADSASEVQDLLQADEAEEEDNSGKNGRLFRLHDLNVEVRTGELVAIVGQVGSGKTSLLNCMLGEMKRTSGRMMRSGSAAISYASQRAWIRNATVKDNIVFHQPFDAELYSEVVRVCALTQDLNILPAGDSTEIGEKGINLSGGQKQRISLARAVYSACRSAAASGASATPVVLLDDVLSAVDAHVGQHIFFECIAGMLKGVTRVLATHQLQYLPHVDRVIIMHDGAVQASGTYQQLVAQGVDFVGMLQTEGPPDEHADEATDDVIEGDDQRNDALVEQPSAVEPDADALKKGKLVDDEERRTGAVARDVYVRYLMGHGGVSLLIFLFAISVCLEGASQFVNLWLANWSNHAEEADTVFYLSIYLSAGVASSVLALVRQFMWFNSALNCARRLHDRLLESVIRAPMSFFFATPTGRIIARFSKDQEVVDTDFPDLTSDFFLCLFSTFATLMVICGILPWFLLPAIPVMAVYWWIMQHYRKASRELSRLNAMANAPIYAHYSETLEGLDTIRAFHFQRLLKEENESLLVTKLRPYFCYATSHRWLDLRVEAVGAALVVIICLLSLLTKGTLSAGFIGLILTLASTITSNMGWLVRSATMLEANMNRVERILHYTNTVPEAPLALASGQRWDARNKQLLTHRVAAAAHHVDDVTAQDDVRLLDLEDGYRDDDQKAWPSEGRIEFQNAWMRYRHDLDPVLKGINLTIEARHKVGVVGRTGAGKSSLINALFRLVELDDGALCIDGRDISTLGLHQVRSALSIIPQDPVLFEGTIRSNIDPFDVFDAAGSSCDDASLWHALDRVHLSDFVRSLPLGLDTKVETNGQNLSVGQRQLVCMARALLRDSPVLILDEATASVDNKTDRAIQETLRRECGGRTVVVIAHRLHTVIDMDRILVMEQGRVVQYGTPWDLLALADGPLARLVARTGAETSRFLHAEAERARANTASHLSVGGSGE